MKRSCGPLFSAIRTDGTANGKSFRQARGFGRMYTSLLRFRHSIQRWKRREICTEMWIRGNRRTPGWMYMFREGDGAATVNRGGTDICKTHSLQTKLLETRGNAPKMRSAYGNLHQSAAGIGAILDTPLNIQQPLDKRHNPRNQHFQRRAAAAVERRIGRDSDADEVGCMSESRGGYFAVLRAEGSPYGRKASSSRFFGGFCPRALGDDQVGKTIEYEGSSSAGGGSGRAGALKGQQSGEKERHTM
ncbi:hypothetical protein R3P38DRAFT_2772355 [Favolaschia claudopus]|uniref:Uncharacterized protein n=1 Tax=Favolaschia claudopus TaxID=2862362 RepID=A0AAW0C672_9AGAR